MRLYVLALALAGASTGAICGGSWEEATVESLTIRGNNYELVVIPKPRVNGWYKDPYLGGCSRFMVKGSYSWLHAWRFPEFVTHTNHNEALTYLQQAQVAKKTILFGWAGTGFVQIGSDKCVVRSRALHLRNEREDTAVLSFQDAI